MSQTIFVKICSLDDTELAPTIMDCILKASAPHKLRFGISLMYKDTNTLKEFMAVKKDAEGFGAQFRVVTQPFTKNNIGVGRARSVVDSMYKNEDYVLQIDSHSWFPHNWDNTLTSLIMYRDPKTIFTGYGSPYTYENGKREPKDIGKLLYPELINDKLFCEWLPQNWRPIYPDTTDMFIPSKFCANFSFGTSKWGEYSGVFEKAIFYSEEPVQTQKLKAKGFKLLYPNLDEPMICHLYYNDIGEYGKRYRFTDYIGEFESNYLMNVMDKHYYENFTV